jgi:hypothetical protein
MTRSKFSTKVVLLATGIGLSIAAFAGSQPAAAQSYSGAYTCPAGTVYDPTYGCTNEGADDFGYNYGYPYGYGYSYPTILRGYPDHRFGHMGMGAGGTIAHHGMGFGHSIDVAHFGGGGFAHVGGFGHGMSGGFGHGGIGMGIAGGHSIGGGFGHGMAGGFGHGGGGGHR